jgi:hypothetical protein
MMSPHDARVIETLGKRFQAGDPIAAFQAIRVAALAVREYDSDPALDTYPDWLKSAINNAIQRVTFGTCKTFEEGMGLPRGRKRSVYEQVTQRLREDSALAILTAIQEGAKSAGLRVDVYASVADSWEELLSERPYKQTEKNESFADKETVRQWCKKARKRNAQDTWTEFVCRLREGIIARIIETKTVAPWGK